MKKYVSICNGCTGYVETANDKDALIYKMATKRKCDKCDYIFGEIEGGILWNYRIKQLSSPYLDEKFLEIAKPRENLRKEFADKKIVFVMMKFPDNTYTPEQKDKNEKIFNVIKSVLDQNGLIGLKADYKNYANDLLPNVMTYMEECGYGIAVFDDVGEFNCNVLFEAGYMIASGKEVGFFKDNTLSSIPSDVVSKLYQPFDSKDPNTIKIELKKWIDQKIHD